MSERKSALDKLLSMLDNTDMGTAILMPMLREPLCRVLLTFLQKRYMSAQPIQETILRSPSLVL